MSDLMDLEDLVTMEDLASVVEDVPVKKKRGRPRKRPHDIEAVGCHMGIQEILKICKKNKYEDEEYQDNRDVFDVEEYENALRELPDAEDMPNCPHPRPQKAGRRGRKKKPVEVPIEELNASAALLKDRTTIDFKIEVEREDSIMDHHQPLLENVLVPGASDLKFSYNQEIITQNEAIEAIFSELNIQPRLLDCFINRSTMIVKYAELMESLNEKYNWQTGIWKKMFCKLNIDVTHELNDKFHKIIELDVDFAAALRRYGDLLNKSRLDQRMLIDKLDDAEEEIKSADPNFDEACIWGLKPLRRAFAPPFFKTVDGLVSAPAPCPLTRLPNTNPNSKDEHFIDPDAIFKRDKQKWTIKDINILRGIVTQCLQDQLRTSMKNRFDLILFDCEEDLRKREEALRAEGPNPNGQIFKKKRGRGRPKKKMLSMEEQESLFGVAHPLLYELTGGIRITYSATPPKIEEWRDAGLKAIKTLSLLELLARAEKYNIAIDWGYISKQMTEKSRKLRSNEDCFLIYQHQLLLNSNHQRWGAREFQLLKELVSQKNYNNWDEISSRFEHRKSYECFFRFRNKIQTANKKVKWTKEADKVLVVAALQTEGDWEKVTEAVSRVDPCATKKQIQERWKKKVNPVLKQGSFSRVEDALLFLTMEKLKPLLNREGHFGSIMAYLPWRFETTWRDRATQLFADWIVPWTMEEDKLLLEYEKTYKRNWSLISQKFSSFKTRKGCLTRFRILQNQLKTFKTVDSYHQRYSKTRFNVIQFTHLNEILHLLGNIYPIKFEGKFFGISNNRPPSNERLQYLLLGFDRKVMANAIRSIKSYIEARNIFWADWTKSQASKKKIATSTTKNAGRGKKTKVNSEERVTNRKLPEEPKENDTSATNKLAMVVKCPNMNSHSIDDVNKATSTRKGPKMKYTGPEYEKNKPKGGRGRKKKGPVAKKVAKEKVDKVKISRVKVTKEKVLVRVKVSKKKVLAKEKVARVKVSKNKVLAKEKVARVKVSKNKVLAKEKVARVKVSKKKVLAKKKVDKEKVLAKEKVARVKVSKIKVLTKKIVDKEKVLAKEKVVKEKVVRVKDVVKEKLIKGKVARVKVVKEKRARVKVAKGKVARANMAKEKVTKVKVAKEEVAKVKMVKVKAAKKVVKRKVIKIKLPKKALKEEVATASKAPKVKKRKLDEIEP